MSGALRCAVCHLPIVDRDGTYLHAMPTPAFTAADLGPGPNSDRYRAAMTEWGTELALHVIRTGTHRARPDPSARVL